MKLRRQPPRPGGSGSGGGRRSARGADWRPRRIDRLGGRRIGFPGLRLPGLRLSGLRLPGVRRLDAPARPALLGVGRRGFTPTRAAALLVLLASAGGLYGAGASDAFGYRELSVNGLRWTAAAAVDDVLADVELERGTNLFALRTAPIVERLARLPAVASARVEVRLPDRLTIVIREREAIVGWAAHDAVFAVDAGGTAFAVAGPDAVPAAFDGVPIVADTRTINLATFHVGSTLDPVDLDTAARLASLVPADVGSSATALVVSVSDANGFVVTAVPGGWTAVFGFYTQNLRTTDLIPGQVRLLRSLLAGREATVERVILADDRNGTYVPRATVEAPAPDAAP